MPSAVEAILAQVESKRRNLDAICSALYGLEPEHQAQLQLLYETALSEAWDSPGDFHKAADWFITENRALGGVTPFEACKTSKGAAEVRRVIGTIAFGGVA